MIIKSSANLCTDYDAFSHLAHTANEPIFITKDGEGDLVLMSIEYYEQLLESQALPQRHMAEATPKNAKKGAIPMTEHLLGRILREAYDNAPRGQQVASIHVFSVYYADCIERERLNKKEILKAAGLPESYQTEISKGMNLAQYVSVKEKIATYFSEIQASLV